MPYDIEIPELKHTMTFEDDVPLDMAVQVAEKYKAENYQPGLINTLGRGISRGVTQAKIMGGSVQKAFGEAIGSEGDVQAGEELASSAEAELAEKQKLMGPRERISTVDEFNEKGLAAGAKAFLDPYKLASSVGEMLPVMGATVAAGVVGGPAAAGVVGGLAEASMTYREADKEGATVAQKMLAGGSMLAGAGVLNAAGMGKLLAPLSSKGLLGRFGQALLAGNIEAATEMLESPVEGFSRELAGLDPNWKDRLKEATEVYLPSLVMGAVTSGGLAENIDDSAFKTQKDKIEEQIKAAEDAAAGIKGKVDRGEITTAQAIEELRTVPVMEMTDVEREAFVTAAQAKGTTVKSLVGKLAKRDKAYTSADITYLATILEAKDKTKKKQVFSAETTVEQYMRDAGLKIEGDKYDPVMSDEMKAKLKYVYRGASAEELDLTAAIWEHMARQATRGLPYGPEALLNEALADIKPMGKGVGKNAMQSPEELELRQSMKAKERLPHTVVRGLNRNGIVDYIEQNKSHVLNPDRVSFRYLPGVGMEVSVDGKVNGIYEAKGKASNPEAFKKIFIRDNSEYQDIREQIYSAGTDEEVLTLVKDFNLPSDLLDNTYPTKVYHGTPHEFDLPDLSPDRQSTGGSGDYWKSFWTTESFEEAENYAGGPQKITKTSFSPEVAKSVATEAKKMLEFSVVDKLTDITATEYQKLNLVIDSLKTLSDIEDKGKWNTLTDEETMYHRLQNVWEYRGLLERLGIDWQPLILNISKFDRQVIYKSPQVNEYYLDIRNPFDMDNFAVHFKEPGFKDRFIGALASFMVDNDWDFGVVLRGVSPPNFRTAEGTMTPESAEANAIYLANYYADESYATRRPAPFRMLLNVMAKVSFEETTKFLDTLGFDGAFHYTRQYGGSRRVKQWITWNPEQIKQVHKVETEELYSMVDMREAFQQKKDRSAAIQALKSSKPPEIADFTSSIPDARKALYNKFSEELAKVTGAEGPGGPTARVLGELINKYYPKLDNGIYELPKGWLADDLKYYQDSYRNIARELASYLEVRELHSKTKAVIFGSITAVDKARKQISMNTAAKMQFPAVKYIIRGAKAADFSTAIHEFTHFLVQTSAGNFRSLIEEKMGAKVETWTEAQHEAFAVGFENWIINGGESTHNAESSKVYVFLRRKLKEVLENRLVQGFVRPEWEKKPELEGAFAYLLDSGRPEDTAANFVAAVTKGVKGVKVEAPAEVKDLNQILIVKESTFEPGSLDIWGAEALAELNRPKAIQSMLKRYAEGGNLTPGEATAVAMVNVLVNHANADIARHYITKSSIRAYSKMATDIADVARNSRSKAGQMLGLYRAIVQVENFVAALKAAGKEMDEATLKMALDAINSGDFSLLNAVQQNLTPTDKAKGIIQAVFYNSLLSSPRTWAVNGLSNVLWSTYLIAHQGIVAPIDKAISLLAPSYSRGHAIGEWTQMLRAMMNPGVHYDGLKEAKEAFLDLEGLMNQSGREITKWEEEAGFLRSIMALEGAIGRKPAAVITAPTRFMAAMDVYAKAVAEKMYDNAVHLRIDKARKAGPDVFNKFVLSFVKENLSSIRVNKKMADQLKVNYDGALRKVPSAGFNWADIKDADILNDAERWIAAAVINGRAIYAEHATFQDEAGAFTRRIAGGIRNLPFGIGRVFVPFAYTLANIAKRGAELLPGVGIAFGVRGKLSAAEIIAQQLEGGFIALLVWNMMEAGKLTGPPPDDPAERDSWRRTGKTAYSMLINGQWVDYRTFDPFGSQMAMVTSALEEWYRETARETNPRVQQHTAMQKFNAVAIAARDSFVQNSWLRGVGTFFGGDAFEVENVETRMSTALIPYSSLWRTMHKSYEAYQTGEVKLKDMSYASTFGDSFPGGEVFIQKLVEKGYLAPPEFRKNNFGEVLSQKSTWWKEWLPIRYQAAIDDPVEKELEGLQVYPGMPGRVVTVTKKRGRERMPDSYYGEYLMDFGPQAKERLQTLMSKPHYKTATKGRKVKMVEDTLESTRSAALERIKGKMRRDIFAGRFDEEPVLQNVTEPTSP